MPGYFLNGAAIAATPDYYRQNTIIDEERGWLYQPSYRWDRNRRTEQSTRDPIGHAAGWMWGGANGIDPDGTVGLAPLMGYDNLADVYNVWSPWLVLSKGTTRPYYISGVIYDQTNVPVSGAAVSSFVTSTNVLDGTTVSQSDGSYQVPCYNRAATHYVNSYKVGSPDAAGESANTITPAQ